MKVAVVGAGVMGCATAWALRERGAEVTVHEQFGLDHDRGSSHGRTRIFRVAYPEVEWVRLAQEAYAGWRDLDPDVLGLYGLIDRKSTRLNSSHMSISYAVFCLKKKKKK